MAQRESRVSSFELMEDVQSKQDSNPRPYFKSYGSLTTRRGQHLLKKGTLPVSDVLLPSTGNRCMERYTERVGLRLGGEYFHEHISDSVTAVHLPRGSYCD